MGGELTGRIEPCPAQHAHEVIEVHVRSIHPEASRPLTTKAPPRSTDRASNGARPDGSSNGHAQRVPPHNLDSEESLLGALLLSRDACDTVIGTIATQDLYKPAHQLVYDAITALHSADQPVDPDTVGDILHRDGNLDTIGGRRALVGFQARTNPANAKRYAQIIQHHAVLRAVITFGGEITADAYTLPDDAGSIRRRLETLLEILDRTTARGGARPFTDVMASWMEGMNLRATGDTSAVSTGFIDLDKVLGGGLHPGQLVVICGRTSMGKTAMAGGLALNIAERAPVLVCSIEMRELELADRWVAAAAKVDLATIRAATLNLDDWGRVDRAVERLNTKPVWVDDHDDITVSYLRGLARSLPQPPAVIIVDYLQLLRPGAKFDNRQEAVADISSSLKKLARRLQIPIVALAQLNRSAESRSDKRPMLSDLRESGSIENDADVVIGLYREKYYKPSNDDDILEAIVMKQRSGPLQTVHLHFAAEISAVLNLADREDF